MGKIIKFPSNEEGYFGLCPKCKKTDGYCNIYKDIWFRCDTHKVKWYAGYGLFSSWEYETEEKWQQNTEFLSSYRKVEPFFPPDLRVSSDPDENDSDMPF